MEKTSYIANLVLLTEASSLQQCFDHIQRRGDAGCKGTGQAAGHAMGNGVVFFPGIHNLRQ